MTRTRTRAFAAVAASVLSLTAFTACSVSIGGSTMDDKKIEKAGKGLLKDKLGDEKVASVSCPSGKDAKKDTSFTCTFKGAEGTSGTLKVDVTSDDGDYTVRTDTFKFTADRVEKEITSDFATEYPDQAANLSKVECPDDIPSEDGDSTTCTLTDGTGATADLTVTFDKTNGLQWDFDEVFGS